MALASFGDYRFSPRQHNGYPTDELVMSAANSRRDGAYKLAPGYAGEFGVTPHPGPLPQGAGCAIVGVITEIVAVRPVLGRLEQHLYASFALAGGIGGLAGFSAANCCSPISPMVAC